MTVPIRDKLFAGLEALGYQRDHSARTSKYVVMARSDQPGVSYYIGWSGALRRGRTAGTSTPIMPKAKAAIIAAGEKG
jgi:hypothetical protein